MVDLTNVETVNVPLEEVPDVFPSLWLPPELYFKQPFFVRLFVRRSSLVPGDPSKHPLIEYVISAIHSKTLRAKCYPTTADLTVPDSTRENGAPARVNPDTLRTPIKCCQRCQAQEIVQVSGTKETMGPYRVAIKDVDSANWPPEVPKDLYVFVFNQCKSFCSSSRLHLRCNLVIGMSVLNDPCFAYSNVFSVLSKIVKKSKKRPPNPTLDSAIPLSVQRALAEQNSLSIYRSRSQQLLQPQLVSQQPQTQPQSQRVQTLDQEDSEATFTLPAKRPMTSVGESMLHPPQQQRSLQPPQSQVRPPPLQPHAQLATDDNKATVQKSLGIVEQPQPPQQQPLLPPTPLAQKPESSILFQQNPSPDFLTDNEGTPSVVINALGGVAINAVSPVGGGSAVVNGVVPGSSSSDTNCDTSSNASNTSSVCSSTTAASSAGMRQDASPSTPGCWTIDVPTIGPSTVALPSTPSLATSNVPSLTTTTMPTTSSALSGSNEVATAILTVPPPPRRTSPTLSDVLKSPAIPHDQLSSTKLLSNVYSLLQKKVCP